LGSPVYPDFGVELMGGAWLRGDHWQPIGRIGWSHGFGNGIAVDALRFGGGAALGAAFWSERLWIGGALEAAVGGAVAHGGGSSAPALWTGTLDPTALLELRLLDRLLLGVQLGPEVWLTTLHFGGTGTGVQWGPARFNAGLRLGVIFGG